MRSKLIRRAVNQILEGKDIRKVLAESAETGYWVDYSLGNPVSCSRDFYEKLKAGFELSDILPYLRDTVSESVFSEVLSAYDPDCKVSLSFELTDSWGNDTHIGQDSDEAGEAIDVPAVNVLVKWSGRADLTDEEVLAELESACDWFGVEVPSNPSKAFNILAANALAGADPVNRWEGKNGGDYVEEEGELSPDYTGLSLSYDWIHDIRPTE